MDSIVAQVNELGLKSCALEDFITVTYCIIDELYRPLSHLVKRSGPPPRFSDSEVICLHLVGQMMFDSQLAWHKYVDKNYRHLFPELLEASRYHRRCKAIQRLIDVIRLQLLVFMDAHLQEWHVMAAMEWTVCPYLFADTPGQVGTNGLHRNSKWNIPAYMVIALHKSRIFTDLSST